jgi:hypothetical protein
MGDRRVIGSPLAFFTKIEKRLGHLKEHLDVPSAFASSLWLQGWQTNC